MKLVADLEQPLSLTPAENELVELAKQAVAPFNLTVSMSNDSVAYEAEARLYRSDTGELFIGFFANGPFPEPIEFTFPRRLTADLVPNGELALMAHIELMSWWNGLKERGFRDIKEDFKGN